MKTKLYFLAILFSFSFSNVNAQCPSGDVQLLSQNEVYSFVSTYPNCTHITGNLEIGDFELWSYDINDLSGLSNITKIDGMLGVFYTHVTSLNGFNNLNELGSLNIVGNNNMTSISELINLSEISNGQLQIGLNRELSSLEGLNNIQRIVNGRLYIGVDMLSLMSLQELNNLTSVDGLVNINVPNLSNLGGLENLEYIGGDLIVWGTNVANVEPLSNLTYVGGYISIGENPNLTSLNGIENFAISVEGEPIGVYLTDNNSLAQCNLPNICEYLSLNSTDYPRDITGNTGNCTDEQAVLAACGLGINDVENSSTNWNVVYQKNTGSFLIQTNGFKMSEIEVYDLSGKLIKSIQNINSNREELRVFTPETILIIKVKSQEGNSFAKKVMMK